jgi:hypothetical protein
MTFDETCDLVIALCTSDAAVARRHELHFACGLPGLLQVGDRRHAWDDLSLLPCPPGPDLQAAWGWLQ